MSNPSQIADPHVPSLSQLLDDIRQGFLLVPRFQRPFIWSIAQQLDLLRSVRDGLPIGAILIWRTRTQELPCYETMGRHRVGRRDTSPGSTRQYVLDGFQRLSTLYGALHHEKAPADDEEADPPFYLDLETADFCTEPDEGPADRFLPMDILLQRMEVLRWERKISNDRWIENAELMFNAFDRCKIPVIPLVTEDLDVATQAFERINTQLTPVSKLHVAHALSWTPEFDLMDEVRALKEEMLAPAGWGKVDDDILLDVCALHLGIDLYEKQMGRAVARKLREQPEALRSSVEGLETTAWLAGLIGLSSPALFPYGRQIVLLAAALHPSAELRPHTRRLLTAWLWLTTYAELFAGVSGGRFQRVLESLREACNTGRLAWPGWRPFARRPLPPRFDFRSARGKALALRLAELHPEWISGKRVEWPGQKSSETLGESLLQAVPRHALSASRFACAGNRFLVPPEHAAAFRSELLELVIDPLSPEERDRRRAWLRTHAVSDAALAYLDNCDFEAFVTQREADLNQLEEEFVARHLPCLAPDPAGE